MPKGLLHLSRRRKSKMGRKKDGDDSEIQSLCGKKLSGQNPSNLKTHLKSFHKTLYLEFENKEKERKNNVEEGKMVQRRTTGDVESGKQLTIDFTTKNNTKLSSAEHKRLETVVLKYFCKSGDCLNKIDHPHTGQMTAGCLHKCLDFWGIKRDKILLVVTDNGSNMIKAITLLNEQFNSIPPESSSVGEEPDDDLNDTDLDYDVQDEDLESILQDVQVTRMACMPHTIQLIIKEMDKLSSSKNLITKARGLVKKVRKSPLLVEKLISKCGKTLIISCATRWNSTLMMLQRLLDVKVFLNEVLDENGIDSLLTSEWAVIDEICKLLEPFEQHTNLLQSDSVAISSVLASIMDIEAHLYSTPYCKPLARNMLKNLQGRFACLLDPACEHFNPIPAAATLLDPTMPPVLLQPRLEPLLTAAKKFILNQAGRPVYTSLVKGSCSKSGADEIGPPKKKFRFLIDRLNEENRHESGSNICGPAVVSCGADLGNFLMEQKCRMLSPGETALSFWISRKKALPILSAVALDLVAAPASQAYVERIFSLCGQLSVGKRNRVGAESLEKRVFLKLNHTIL